MCVDPVVGVFPGAWVHRSEKVFLIYLLYVVPGIRDPVDGDLACCAVMHVNIKYSLGLA